MTDTALIERLSQELDGVIFYDGGCSYPVRLMQSNIYHLELLKKCLTALEQSQWVSVSDNMPAIGKIVQVAGGRAYLDFNAAWWTVEESPPRKIQWNVTHWKPITPPQEEVEI